MNLSTTKQISMTSLLVYVKPPLSFKEIKDNKKFSLVPKRTWLHISHFIWEDNLLKTKTSHVCSDFLNK